MNETESRPNDNFWQHSVWRYWQNPKTGFIDKEYMFGLNKESRVFYTDVDIFDYWGIGFKQEEKKTDFSSKPDSCVSFFNQRGPSYFYLSKLVLNFFLGGDRMSS